VLFPGPAIVSDAFCFHAVGGGFAGAMIQGLRRSTFSNEAGLGLAAIAHATAKTSEPVREGIVALLEPFIDTVIICNLTALVIIITGVYHNPDLAGSKLASAAFGEAIAWFSYLLAIAVFLFSFSTLISVAYYGQVSWEYLFSSRGTIIFKVLFLAAVWLGSIASPQAVLQFGDAISFAKAFPNLLGIFLLSNQVAIDLEDYLHRLHTGRMHHSS